MNDQSTAGTEELIETGSKTQSLRQLLYKHIPANHANITVIHHTCSIQNKTF